MTKKTEETESKIDQIIADFTKHGIKVFPVHGVVDGKCTCGNPKCGSVGKHSVVGKWQESATLDEEQISKWWTKNPKWNVGILLGPESGICDIEFDDDEGKATAEELLSDIATPAYKSSRSVHRLFRLPKSEALSGAMTKVKGLEIRLGFNPAYSVAPPSQHKSGSKYQWIEGCSTNRSRNC